MSIIKTTTANFEKDVLQSDKPVLLDFSAEWCGPCKALEPTLEKIAASRDDITIVKLDVDESKDIAQKYNVRSMPTLMIFNQGQPVSRFSGVRSENNLNAWINENKDNTELTEAEPKDEITGKDIVSDEALDKIKSKRSVFGFIKSNLVNIGVIGGGIALTTVAATPVAMALGIAAVATGAHSVYKSTKTGNFFMKIMKQVNKSDKDGLEKSLDKALGFNPYTFFTRTFVKGLVTAAAGIGLVTASGGLALGLLGGAVALYGIAGASTSALGLAFTPMATRKFKELAEKSPEEIANDINKALSKENLGKKPKVGAKPAGQTFNAKAPVNDDTPDTKALSAPEQKKPAPPKQG